MLLLVDRYPTRRLFQQHLQPRASEHDRATVAYRGCRARGRARLDGREIAVPRGVVQLAAIDQPCSGHRECRIAPGRRGRRPNHGRARATALAAPAAAASAIASSETRAHRSREGMQPNKPARWLSSYIVERQQHLVVYFGAFPEPELGWVLRMLPCMYGRDVEPLAPVGLKGAWQRQRSG